MRIAIIARGCRPGAGIELYTHELANRLSLRHEVTLITDPREVRGDNMSVVPVSIPRKPLWYSIWSFSTRAGLAARQHTYDIVHTQGSDGNWGDIVTAHSCHVAGMLASLKRNPSLVNRFRKCLSPAHRAVVMQERAAFSQARLIIAVSRCVRRQIQAAYPATCKIPVLVIYPGVDTQAFSPAKMESLRLASRRQYGFTQEHTVFVMVANSPRLKGADRLIRSIAAIRNEKIHLLILSGSKNIPGLWRLARQCGILQRVHVSTVSENPVSAYAAGDVYAALPEYESFGLTILEAMACGLPVIVTRNAGVAELLQPGQEGFLLPTRVDTQTVAQAMDCLIKDKEARKRMGHAARLTAEKYTWERMVREIEEIYVQMLEDKKKQRP